MRYNKFKMFLAVAAGTLAGIAIYYPFARGRWGTALGILGVCVGYSIVVFGLVWSVEKWDFPAKNPRSARTILVVHCMYLLWVAEVVNYGLLVQSSLPRWLDAPLGIGRSRSTTGFEYLLMATIGITLLVEVIWLLRNIPRKARVGADSADE
jgi:hypothetical protein